MDPEDTADELLADDPMGDPFLADAAPEMEGDELEPGDDADSMQVLAVEEMMEAMRDTDTDKFRSALDAFLDAR